LNFRLLRTLGIFRIFYPWNWLGVFRRQAKDTLPEASIPRPTPAGETAGRWEEEVEVGPKASTAVKQKR